MHKNRNARQRPAGNLLSMSILGIIAASFCFLNSYTGDFVFDDSEAIVNNHDVQNSPPYKIFQNDFWGTYLSNNKSHKSYRPLTILSFRFHYWMRGRLDPKDFHIVNIILHTLVCVILLFVFEILLDWKEPQIAYNAAMLFSVHPIHTEAVSGIVGRADVLSGLFMWLSLISYYKCTSSTSLFTQLIGMFLCIINSAIAMLCKETGITILGVCIIYDIVIVNKILPFEVFNILRLKYTYNEMKTLIISKTALLMRCVLLTIVCISFLLLRFYIMGFSKPVFKPIDNPTSFLENVFLRIINYNYIYCLNLWLLICPEWLCFDWSMGCVPLIHGIDFRIIFIICLWVLFGLLILILLSEKDYILSRIITISMGLLVIPFLPASNIFFTVGFVLAERTLYIPSAGYCLLVAVGYKLLSICMKNSKVLSMLYCILLITFFARSWSRSEQWKTEITLFQSGLNVCPLNAKVHYNVGKNAADRGNTQFAKLEYQEALRLNPNYTQAMNNLGNLYKDEKAYDLAEKVLKQAVNIQNDFAAAWMNLGVVLTAQKKYKEAEECFITAISHRNKYPDCYYNLGLLYLAIKENDKALKAWKIATKQKPKHKQAWTNMILLLDNIGEREKALKVSNQALFQLPEDPSINFNTGNLLGKMDQFKMAEYHFKKAINEDPKNPNFYTNLGVLYHRWNRFDKAEEAYRKALKLNPESTIINENLNKLNNIKLKRSNAT
ncbi:protein O-mannosyl-transferase TMTC4-like [Phymastichus coffea]|uniref:protein O-mannosyl-transferase TMTC4-like n=1 Tax=Phymastichus coffea TaxID=108790 RepID=UPI00273AD13A|nr:protein O-mannosyl-transferase TMTC4-like [Phymastichus coffea]